jgi:hypothetical protein
MTKNLKVLIKNNFGNDCVYPYCEFSSMITEITGTKTLTDSTIARLKSYGYSFEVVAGQQEI